MFSVCCWSAWRLGSCEEHGHQENVTNTQLTDNFQHDHWQSVQDSVHCHKGYWFVCQHCVHDFQQLIFVSICIVLHTQYVQSACASHTNSKVWVNALGLLGSPYNTNLRQNSSGNSWNSCHLIHLLYGTWLLSGCISEAFFNILEICGIYLLPVSDRSYVKFSSSRWNGLSILIWGVWKFWILVSTTCWVNWWSSLLGHGKFSCINLVLSLTDAQFSHFLNLITQAAFVLGVGWGSWVVIDFAGNGMPWSFYFVKFD